MRRGTKRREGHAHPKRPNIYVLRNLVGGLSSSPFLSRSSWATEPSRSQESFLDPIFVGVLTVLERLYYAVTPAFHTCRQVLVCLACINTLSRLSINAAVFSVMGCDILAPVFTTCQLRSRICKGPPGVTVRTLHSRTSWPYPIIDCHLGPHDCRVHVSKYLAEGEKKIERRKKERGGRGEGRKSVSSTQQKLRTDGIMEPIERLTRWLSKHHAHRALYQAQVYLGCMVSMRVIFFLPHYRTATQ